VQCPRLEDSGLPQARRGYRNQTGRDRAFSGCEVRKTIANQFFSRKSADQVLELRTGHIELR
jgi:hypothetical protein